MNRHLIIDGYNVIAQTNPYLSLARRDDFELACEALISDVASFVEPNRKVTLVFDGTNNPHSTGDPQRIAGVTVIYSAYGIIADSVIEKLAREEREKGIEVEVVTSDAALQWTVMGQTVTRTSSREFAEQLRCSHGELQEACKPSHKKVTLAQRISPEAAEMLRRIRDGEDNPASHLDDTAPNGPKES